MSLTIADALDAYVADRCDVVVAVRRLSNTARRLRATIGDIDLADQSTVAEAVRRYRRSRQDVSAATVRRELITLRAALRLAWRRGDLPFLPAVEVGGPSPGRTRWLSQADARALLARLDGPAGLFLALAIASGARAEAILELTWDRVDLRRRVIDFRAPHPRAARRKHRAVVPFGAGLAARLSAAGAHPDSADACVVPRSYTFVSRAIRSAAADLGLEGVSAHIMRHSVATWLLDEGGVDLLIASRMIGHRSTAITEQIYAHLTTRQLAPAANLLDGVLV